MESIGHELRQHASDYVKRAEAGESMLITVAGRPSALLGPTERKHWNTFDDIADVFDSAHEPTLAGDLIDIDGSMRDPWQPIEELVEIHSP
ncbi:type II toxin-antitoxin system prevent-host-death family antitoxin [Rhodococcus sp. SBT000017]|mgnify:FL=1|uniref:type II toxin-antitoxin system Phd/YefM family antitoxin n=1 Tax=unclassified Rhodococcus (in: high G+C Gram-positive bacteria) TaxID=192944 RepID=UPI000A7C4D8E|nr:MULTISPECIES: type II toxin-antitoxin system prevent-host-death family antitoxin [unclassified Rhodococcus (in: high G+C Gram-positive bacteria)]RMB78000.1 type II toxin-antitoxin system prevent-host-death family antitoxin [Rhodococcus sp. SBT000017]